MLAIALAALSFGASPAFAQFACGRDMPSDRDKADSGGMSIDSARQIVLSHRAFLAGAPLPADATLARNLLTSARNDCTKAVNEKKKRIEARMCLADATYLLRRLGDPSGDLQVAHCNYLAANTLLKTQDETKALALEGIARTYEETTTPNLAIPMRNAIPTSSLTPARIIDFARLYFRTSDAGKADIWYDKLNLLKLPVGYQYSQTEREALREWALLRSGPLQNSQGAIDVWSRLDTAEAHSEVGKFYFNSNRSDLAEREFKRVIQLENEEGAGPRVADASYFLGLMTARNARTAEAWNLARIYVRKAGYSDPRYKRLSCLSLIASGDTKELSSSTESEACQLGISATAEDYATRGAYLFRRMQFLQKCDGKPAAERTRCENDRRDNFIQLARESRKAFSDGQLRLPVINSTMPSPTFDWLLVGSAPRLDNLLRAGEELANSVTQMGGCKNLDLQAPAENTPERDFFARLDLLGCNYKQYLP